MDADDMVSRFEGAQNMGRGIELLGQKFRANRTGRRGDRNVTG